MEFGKVLPSLSVRTTPYDISYDGVVHVGMIPDFVEEMGVLGLTDQYLEPLWHGAEAYVREWEAANSFADGYSTENPAGIREKLPAIADAARRHGRHPTWGAPCQCRRDSSEVGARDLSLTRGSLPRYGVMVSTLAWTVRLLQPGLALE